MWIKWSLFLCPFDSECSRNSISIFSLVLTKSMMHLNHCSKEHAINDFIVCFFSKACGISVYKSTFFLQKPLLACSVAFISSVSLLTPVTRRCCSRRSHPIPPSSNNYDILMERWVALLTCESPWHTHTWGEEQRERNSPGLMTKGL